MTQIEREIESDDVHNKHTSIVSIQERLAQAGVGTVDEITSMVASMGEAGTAVEEEPEEENGPGAAEAEVAEDGPVARRGRREGGANNFFTLDCRTCGIIRGVVPGLNATCRVHTRCSCWFTKAGPSMSSDMLKEDMIGWLARIVASSSEQHAKDAYDIKVKHGMRPRALG